jgi:hypothetical protein
MLLPGQQKLIAEISTVNQQSVLVYQHTRNRLDCNELIFKNIRYGMKSAFIFNE